MASPVNRSGGRRPVAPPARTPARAPAPVRAPALTPAPTGRAQPVARPAIPAAERLRTLSARQVVEQLFQFAGTSETATYGRGLCLLELSQPRRYRDEMGFPTFDALCKSDKYPSRMTASKWMLVVSTFSEPEVKQLGGMDRCYFVVQYFRRQNADPRRALTPNARVLGRALKDMSVRDIQRATQEGTGVSEEELEDGRNAAERLKHELRRREIECGMRTHDHGGEVCVAPHMTVEAVDALTKALRRLRSLEKKLGA